MYKPKGLAGHLLSVCRATHHWWLPLHVCQRKIGLCWMPKQVGSLAWILKAAGAKTGRGDNGRCLNTLLFDRKLGGDGACLLHHLILSPTQIEKNREGIDQSFPTEWTLGFLESFCWVWTSRLRRQNKQKHWFEVKWLLRPTKISIHPPLALSLQLWELAPVPGVYGDQSHHSPCLEIIGQDLTWSHITLLETNISHPKGTVEDYFPFPVWWDMWVPWKIGQLCERNRSWKLIHWSTSALTARRMAGQPSPLTASTRLG